MAINALFDKERKKEIREALKKGDASVFKRRKTVQGGPAETEEIRGLIPSIDNIAQPDLRERLRYFLLEPDGENCQGGDLTWDDMLVACVLEGKLSGIQSALALDADVNLDVSHLGFTDEHGVLLRTPIQLAKTKGRIEIVEYLREQGAKE